MSAHKINCEVIHIDGDALFCPGGARVKAGSSWIIGIVTPTGMCARSFISIFPVAMAMRFSEESPWERGKGYVDVTCPEGHTIFRLTRVKTEEEKDAKPRN